MARLWFTVPSVRQIYELVAEYGIVNLYNNDFGGDGLSLHSKLNINE